MNDKESFAFFAKVLRPLGIDLAVIEYTLVTATRFDRIVAEVRRSVRWLAEHLGEYGADPNRLGPRRGPSGVCGGARCRWMVLTTTRSWTRGRDQRAS